MAYCGAYPGHIAAGDVICMTINVVVHKRSDAPDRQTQFHTHDELEDAHVRCPSARDSVSSPSPNKAKLAVDSTRGRTITQVGVPRPVFCGGGSGGLCRCSFAVVAVHDLRGGEETEIPYQPRSDARSGVGLRFISRTSRKTKDCQ